MKPLRIVIEGRLRAAKRKYGMGLIKAKLRAALKTLVLPLKETSEREIHLSVIMLNLDKICDGKSMKSTTAAESVGRLLEGIFQQALCMQ